jgi:hypothetical protein
MPVMCHLFRGSHHDFPESVIQGAGIISVVRTTDECIRTVLGPVLEYCTVLYCTVLYCTVLYCTVLYCTVLYCTVLYCTVLYGVQKVCPSADLAKVDTQEKAFRSVMSPIDRSCVAEPAL